MLFHMQAICFGSITPHLRILLFYLNKISVYKVCLVIVCYAKCPSRWPVIFWRILLRRSLRHFAGSSICWEIILRPLLDVLSLVFLCNFLHICIIFSVCTSTESPLMDVLLTSEQSLCITLRCGGFFVSFILLCFRGKKTFFPKKPFFFFWGNHQ